MKTINKIKSAAKRCGKDERDRGSLVETVLIIAVLAGVAIAVFSWIGTAIANKGADVAQCVEGANAQNADSSAQNCNSANHAANGHSYNDQGSYKKRYSG